MPSRAVLLDELWVPVRDFLQRGGDVLLLILLTTFVMWVLMLERIWYVRLVHPGEVRNVVNEWESREDRKSWYAKQVRRQLISGIDLKLQTGLPTIKTLVALCPLLGLLGTVTGMIEAFEVMALTGSGNARAMAAGVSKATIPTMAGMVAALSGLYLSVVLERQARDQVEATEDHLTEH